MHIQSLFASNPWHSLPTKNNLTAATNKTSYPFQDTFTSSMTLSALDRTQLANANKVLSIQPFFGKVQDLYGKQIFSPTPELDGASIGLPEINLLIGGTSVAVPNIATQMNKYSGAEFLLFVPGLRRIQPDASWRNPFQNRDNTIYIPFKGQKKTLQILEKDVPNSTNKVFLISDPSNTPEKQTLFSQFNTLYGNGDTPKLEELFGETSRDLKEEHQLLWNEAVAEAGIKLTEAGVINPDVFLVHGSQMAPFAHIMARREPKLFEKDPDIFILHHKYNSETPQPTVAQYYDEAGKVRQLTLPHNWYNGTSWLTMGLEEADLIMADPNFVKTMIADYNFYCPTEPQGNRLVKALEKTHKFLPDTQAMQYGLEYFNPFNASNETESNFDGRVHFTPLNQALFNQDPLGALQAYRASNRQQLFTMIDCYAPDKKRGSLTPMKNGIIYTMLDRICAQKGTMWMLDTLDPFLEKVLNAQVVIASNAGIKHYPEVLKKVENLAKNYPGRFIYLDDQPNRKVLFASSDYGLKPALYEAFGTTHLEMMREGLPTVYHPIDGLKSTVISLDPNQIDTSLETANGIPIKDIDYNYRRIIDRYQGYQLNPSNPMPQDADLQEAILTSRNNLLSALTLSANLTLQERLTLSINALTYVQKQQAWGPIVQNRFVPAFTKGLELKKSA